MKAAIEKAIKNGFYPFKEGRPKVRKIMFDMILDGTGMKFHNTRHTRYQWINIYHLIFGTDFIDKLVGEGKHHTRHISKIDNMWDVNSKVEETDIDVTKAGFHLSQMARPSISRDIEKLKDYVRGLI